MRTLLTTVSLAPLYDTFYYASIEFLELESHANVLCLYYIILGEIQEPIGYSSQKDWCYAIQCTCTETIYNVWKSENRQLHGLATSVGSEGTKMVLISISSPGCTITNWGHKNLSRSCDIQCHWFIYRQDYLGDKEQNKSGLNCSESWLTMIKFEALVILLCCSGQLIL